MLCLPDLKDLKGVDRTLPCLEDLYDAMDKSSRDLGRQD